MTVWLWVFGSIALTLVCARWSRERASAHALGKKGQIAEFAYLLGIGVVTGFVANLQSSLNAILFSLVALLLVLQTPIDLRSHQLARWPTIFSTIGVLAVHVLRFEMSFGWQQVWIPVAVTAALFLLLCLFSIRWPSQLGWGDVLLVLPLSFAVGAVNPVLVVWWLLAAAMTASAHGLSIRRSGKRYLPFGPHLLFAAWVILAIVL